MPPCTRPSDHTVGAAALPQTAPLPLARAAPPAPLWVLALCALGGTLAMHVFIPALPDAAQALGSSPALMQWTVSLYIAGLALGQLVYGPVSDRWGRRPTLMAGLLLYTLSGVAAALASSGSALIAARLFQALGGCAGLVLGRAIVRDTAEPLEAARRTALMNLMVTVGPAIAPLIGAALTAGLGWRAVFQALVLLGLFNLACVWRWVPETLPPQHSGPMPLRELARQNAGLLRSRRFMGYAVAGGCTTTSMYAFIASAPFVFVHQLGRPVHEVGVYVAVLASGVWLGSVLVSRLVRRIALRSLLVGASATCLAAALVLLATVLAGALSVALAVACMFVFTVGVGVASPLALTLAIGANARVVGSASGLYGFTQMAIGAVCTALAAWGGNPALAASLVLVGAGLAGQLALVVAVRAQGAGA